MDFIERKRALERVARNYRGARMGYDANVGRPEPASPERRSYLLGSADAIVQTWAEVTDQPWQHAKDELHKAAFVG